MRCLLSARPTTLWQLLMYFSDQRLSRVAPQSKLDQLDCGKRYIDSPGGFKKDWADPEEGGAAKASVVFNY